jgi:hypothetical protein
MGWITEARTVFDEVIVLIDQKHATPGTVARAERVATTVARNNNDLWRDPDRFSLLAACNADWVFILEYDEQLGSEWQQPGWRRILETTDFTHFWILRRWTVPGGQYICDTPWWPDFQLRLFRNRLEGTIFPRKLHDRIQVPGAGATFRNLMIHHHVLALCSRAEREAKVKHYDQLRPGGGLGHYYLYEDYHPAEVPLPQPTRLNLDHEVIRMEALSDEDMSRISIKIRSVIREVTVSEMFWIDVELMNATNEPLYSCPPFPVNLSYHWIQQNTQVLIVFEGERSGVFPCAPAKAIAPWKLMVFAPSEPGEYILQITAVQDGIRWFDGVNPAILQELIITVREKPSNVGSQRGLDYESQGA